MKNIRRLPDAEFELMRIVWQNDPPMSTTRIMTDLDPDRSWKPQTVLTLLLRLINKGFLASAKVGKDRTYAPLISREEYLRAETGSFFAKLHDGSISSLVNALYDGDSLSTEKIADLRLWLDQKAGVE